MYSDNLYGKRTLVKICDGQIASQLSDATIIAKGFMGTVEYYKIWPDNTPI